MAILPSSFGPQSGLQMLTGMLQMQVGQGRSLTITDQIISSFLWSVGVTKQYMMRSSVDPAMIMREQAVGLISNVRI